MDSFVYIEAWRESEKWLNIHRLAPVCNKTIQRNVSQKFIIVLFNTKMDSEKEQAMNLRDKS